MDDKIIIKNALFKANLGITEKERKTAQNIIISVEIFCDIKKASMSDKIEDTICYFTVLKKIKTILENNSYSLIEKLAEDISNLILNFNKVKKVRVIIKKPDIIKNVDWVGVEIERKKTKKNCNCFGSIIFDKLQKSNCKINK